MGQADNMHAALKSVAVGSTTGATYTLPAMYCFQQGKMPTCALP